MLEFTGEGSYHDLKYLRLNNTPTQTALHEKLAALETAEARFPKRCSVRL